MQQDHRRVVRDMRQRQVRIHRHDRRLPRDIRVLPFLREEHLPADQPEIQLLEPHQPASHLLAVAVVYPLLEEEGRYAAE